MGVFNIEKKGKIATITAMLVVLFIIGGLVFAAPKRACNDARDNDNDGLIDYPSDPGCSARTDNTETSPSLICDNGFDETNDADVLADFRLSGGDPGCTSLTNDTLEIDGECDDLFDNDGDSRIDYPNDLGCINYSDNDESNCGDGVCEGGENSVTCPSDCGPTQCNDTIDNDGDGWIYFPLDSKCSSLTDDNESPRDFCNDSDGSNTANAGNVTGEDNSLIFAHFDFCLNNITVNEYYCNGYSGDYNPFSLNQSCVGNFTSMCLNGRCV